MNDTLNELVEFLDKLANRLDGWANESRYGGWSTHQVTANYETANEVRRMAAKIRKSVEVSPSDA